MKPTLLRLAMTDPATGLPNGLAMETFAERLQAIAARQGVGLKVLRLCFPDEAALERALLGLRPHVRRSDMLARTGRTVLSLLLLEGDEGAAETARGRLAALVSAGGPTVFQIEPMIDPSAA